VGQVKGGCGDEYDLYRCNGGYPCLPRHWGRVNGNRAIDVRGEKGNRLVQESTDAFGRFGNSEAFQEWITGPACTRLYNFSFKRIFASNVTIATEYMSLEIIE